jgi:hypothetical protein
MEQFEAQEGSFLIKNDMTSFATHPSREMFIEEWCAPRDGALPIYEVIVEDRPARLHFDVECVLRASTIP